MDGRAFLQSARMLMTVPSEANWRSATGRAYYALLHEGSAALLRWGFPKPAGEQLHQFVRTRFGYNIHPELRPIGVALDRLAQLGNEADYQLGGPGSFASAGPASVVVQTAAVQISVLDAIEGDPVRRGGGIAALRARWP